mmetsp:Transcript_53763/g.125315  ORF Transcript_53763/g.125315 Transcript_53763/m.125315 type:complete len:260 (+) Transcript_53763:76-855(+)
MPTAAVNGVDLYYEDSDPGANRPAAILLHGAGGNSVAWWQQVPVFHSVMRCIVYDIRGYGRTPNPTGDSMAFLIADLEGLVEYLCLSSVILIAQSMGGRAALGFATRHPNKVLAMVMAANWGNFFWTEQIEMAKEFTIPEGHPVAVAKTFPKEQPALYHLSQSIRSLNPPRPKLEGPTPGGPTVDEVKRLPVPVLCIVGADDVVFPPPLVRAFSELLPNAEFVEVDGAGHSVYFEKAELFNKLVLDFLMKHVEDVKLKT